MMHTLSRPFQPCFPVSSPVPDSTVTPIIPNFPSHLSTHVTIVRNYAPGGRGLYLHAMLTGGCCRTCRIHLSSFQKQKSRGRYCSALHKRGDGSILSAPKKSMTLILQCTDNGDTDAPLHTIVPTSLGVRGPIYCGNQEIRRPRISWRLGLPCSHWTKAPPLGFQGSSRTARPRVGHCEMWRSPIARMRRWWWRWLR
jgi:hypothetical protein